MLKRWNQTKLQEGFTLTELVLTTAIIGIVAVVAIPQFSKSQARAYDANAKASLRSVFTACKDFWTFNSSNSPCLLNTVSNSEFGFVPADGVEIQIESNGNNTEYDFSAVATHPSSSNAYAIDHRGIITLISGGCSQTAHADTQNLKKNAKGGCSSTPENTPSKSKSKSKGKSKS